MGRTRTIVGLAAGTLAAALAAPVAASAGTQVDVIVVYVDGVSDSTTTTAAVARQHRAEPRWVFEHALEGFAGSVPEGRLRGLRNDPRVASVELDQGVTTAGQSLPTGIDRVFADDNADIDIDGTDDVRVDVDVAVIDTGIDLDHPDLVVAGSTNCLNHSGGPPFRRTYTCDGTGDDGNGHGTHVGGTIGAIDDGAGVVGVAPGARLWGVKVLDDNGSGSNGSVIAGIDWVTANAGTIEVANLSLGGSESSAVDSALSAAADAGVALAIAAGNSNADVDGYGPAGHPKALTVSALADYDGQPGGGASPTCNDHGPDDGFATFSNHGDGQGDDVDVIAPGVCILSTVPGGGYDGSYSGTSMAAPHVAGALALLASGTNDPTSLSDVQALYDTITSTGNTNYTRANDGDRTREPLLDVSSSAFAPTFTDGSGGGGGGGDTNTAPTASFTYSCTDLGCSFDGTGSSDPDGDTITHAWDFGDDGTATGATASHTYGADGTYTVTLTISDGSLSDSTSQSVTVSSSSADGITLSATGYKVRGRHHADLAWSGATSTNVDVYRDGALITTTANDGAYTDSTNVVGGGSTTYTVCEAGTSTCSNEATVTY